MSGYLATKRKPDIEAHFIQRVDNLSKTRSDAIGGSGGGTAGSGSHGERRGEEQAWFGEEVEELVTL